MLEAGEYIKALGTVAILTRVVCYSLERFGRIYIVLFAARSAAAAVHVYLTESYPSLVAEGIGALIATKRNDGVVHVDDERLGCLQYDPGRVIRSW